MAQFLSKQSKKQLDIIVPLGVAGYFFYQHSSGKGKMKDAVIASIIILIIGYIIVSQITRGFCEDCVTN
jgi:hypothetical protein